ncbi:MAG: hypothetical protein HKN58_02095 [Xanthomonadales bacterium]|nr:hypothetical protein [Xanthomonadales bacterium]
MMTEQARIIARFAILVLVVALAGCATTGAPAKQIAERAQARWDALVAGDLDTAYGYLSPAYRSSVNSMQYQRRILLQKVRWTGAEYIDSDCLEDSCKVRISLDFSLIGALPGVRRFNGTQEIEETWIKSGGKWWYVPEK